MEGGASGVEGAVADSPSAAADKPRRKPRTPRTGGAESDASGEGGAGTGAPRQRVPRQRNRTQWSEDHAPSTEPLEPAPKMRDATAESALGVYKPRYTSDMAIVVWSKKCVFRMFSFAYLWCWWG